MACSSLALRSSLLLVGVAALLTGCPDAPVTPIEGDSSTTDAELTTTGATCMPGQSIDCTCPDGSPSTRPCRLDGSGYDACECDSDPDTSGDATATTSNDTTTTGETTTGPQCTSDEECTELPVTECQVPICGEDGVCVPDDAPFGTPCGDATDDECTDPDTCDNSGTCQANHVDEGVACTTCGGDTCTCAAGACVECAAFAPTNNFVTTRAIEGWELTGSWGLHRSAPQSELAAGVEFVGQLLGSDGNRVAPFPGAELETSYARTPPTPLPAMIIFLSWNVDEGGGLSDNKTVRVSVDGGTTWDTLVDCAVDPSWPMCQPSTAQDPAVFDLVQIPVPPALQGQLGIVEFGYDTGDSCCDFEQGWYIDSLNVATECRCAVDEDCTAYGTTCGTGYCAASGECGLMGMPEDSPCGDPFDNECNGADGCDGVGYCRDNVQPTGLAPCDDCPGGGICSFCDAGQCLDCLSFTDFTGFSDPGGMPPWTVMATVGTADWGFYTEAPLNQNGTGPTLFPNGPVYGTDGNRNPPYPGSESESSQVITSIGTVPFELIFGSWNVDEGSFFDTKSIAISVDGGMSWTALVDCESGLNPQPFCDFRDDLRLIDDWDVIVLDTSPWFGMNGQLRFTYATGDSCCGFERGWYLDFSYAICDDVAFP
ncbi:hypothetical protein [Paraliomyxa miuraensis]|uniref:hypothetical protein n=1 Tax=Paraliomyxa miuraensis TaxID=376150 RepID=UPI002250DC5D|nr:hypothetical protein [Paraliomyxa miuraensis]MCX4239455.1 hypothetical protein [Paraliomyxa miuraensis]